MLLRPFNKRKGSQTGLTLIEIMIVIALLGTLMGIIITNLSNTQENAQIDQAKLAMAKLSQNLQMYRVDNGRLPTTDQGLGALVKDPGNARKWRGPYAESSSIRDPWGEDFSYESDGRNFKIISAGPNGSVGDDDDVFYPEEEGGSDEG